MDPALVALPDSPSPYRIPLPPAPIITPLGLGHPPRIPPLHAPSHPDRKQRIPSRRPEGWISTLPQTNSDLNTGLAGVGLDEEPRSGVKTRVVSGLQAGGGRRVSGALQYALLPPSTTSDTNDGDIPSSGGNRPRDEHSTITALPPSLPVDDSSSEDITTADHEPVDWDEVNDLTDDIVNPEWMEYVRQQLAALFPDFGGAEDLSPSLDQDSQVDLNTPLHRPHTLSLAELRARGEGVPRLVSDSSTISSESIRTPPTASSMGQIVLHAQDTASRHAMGDAGDAGGSMREELSAMREEMERLRNFVGDLAGGMRQQSVDAFQLEVEGSTIIRPPAPQGLLDNAELCADIIRCLHQTLALADRGNLEDPDIFTTANLENVLLRLRGTGLGGTFAE